MEELDKKLWGQLMKLAKRIGFGEAKVIFKDGRPIKVYEIVKSVDLEKGNEV